MGSIWQTFVSSLRVYERSALDGLNDSYDGRYNSDGAEKSLVSFIIQLFEFLLTIVGSPRFIKVFGDNISELVYYTIAFLQMIEQQTQSEELECALREQAAAVDGSGSNKAFETNANNSMAHDTTTANSSTIVLNSEFTPYVALFNIAVIWFYLYEYSNSFCILEQLFEKIGPITEGIALSICFLLLDVVLL